jgi:thiamine biosynthesis lipoprotein
MRAFSSSVSRISSERRSMASAARAESMRLFRFSFFAMACENEIQLYAGSEDEARRASGAAITEVKRIEEKYSRYRDDSVVTRINKSSGHAPVDIDAETAALLDYANACHVESAGLFDITSGVLRRAWDFRRARPPVRAEIEPLLALIGWEKVEREGDRVFLPVAGMELDFGGFGKEYAVDCAARVCLEHGVVAGLVNLGGDLCALGPQPGDRPWGVGIRHPRPIAAPRHELIATLPLYSGAMATSGDYERYIDFEGRRHSHILDPRSGESIAGPQSVTVHGPSCLVAGSAATIAMLRGEADSVPWLDELGLPFLHVSRAGTVLDRFAAPPACSRAEG